MRRDVSTSVYAHVLLVYLNHVGPRPRMTTTVLCPWQTHQKTTRLHGDFSAVRVLPSFTPPPPHHGFQSGRRQALGGNVDERSLHAHRLRRSDLRVNVNARVGSSVPCSLIGRWGGREMESPSHAWPMESTLLLLFFSIMHRRPVRARKGLLLALASDIRGPRNISLPRSLVQRLQNAMSSTSSGQGVAKKLRFEVRLRLCSNRLCEKLVKSSLGTARSKQIARSHAPV